MGISAVGFAAGGAALGGCVVLSRDRCGRGAEVGRAILGIIISHFASAPDWLGSRFSGLGSISWSRLPSLQ